MATTLDRVKKAIDFGMSGGSAINVNKITEDHSLADDLGADSLDMVELVMAVEDEFEVEISDAEWEQCETVKDICECVEKAIKEQK